MNTPTETDKLCAILDVAQEGMSARSLATLIYGIDTESTRRKIRQLASESRGRILSGPDFGYRSAKHATPDDYEAAANALDSQAFKMHARASFLREQGRTRAIPELPLSMA